MSEINRKRGSIGQNGARWLARQFAYSGPGCPERAIKSTVKPWRPEPIKPKLAPRRNPSWRPPNPKRTACHRGCGAEFPSRHAARKHSRTCQYRSIEDYLYLAAHPEGAD
jgi:hypothetical protein